MNKQKVNTKLQTKQLKKLSSSEFDEIIKEEVKRYKKIGKNESYKEWKEHIKEFIGGLEDNYDIDVSYELRKKTSLAKGYQSCIETISIPTSIALIEAMNNIIEDKMQKAFISIVVIFALIIIAAFNYGNNSLMIDFVDEVERIINKE